MWCDKYRPSRLEDIVGNDRIRERLIRMRDSKALQHMVIHGPPGVGKMLSVRLLANGVLGDGVNDGLLYFTTSDDRGIQTIREKVYQFVPKVTCDRNVPKIIVLQDAGRIGEGVQHMMRRMMENRSHNTVFIFVCTNLNGIIETVQSRCHTIRFQAIQADDMISFFQNICAAEDVECGADVLRYISKLSGGDMRCAINYLQTCSNISRVVDVGVVRCTCVFPHFEIIEQMIAYLAANNIRGAIDKVNTLQAQGYSGIDVVMFVQDYYTQQALIDEDESESENENEDKKDGENNYGGDADADADATAPPSTADGRLHLSVVREIGHSHARITAGGVSNLCQLYGMLGRLCRVYTHARQDDAPSKTKTKTKTKTNTKTNTNTK